MRHMKNVDRYAIVMYRFLSARASSEFMVECCENKT